MGTEQEPLKIRTLVVDDEPLARRNLTLLLGLQADIDIVGECGSGMEALAVIRKSKPDLVYLDVQMPECDGFDVLELLGGDVPCAIIFVTAYDAYALRAFEVGALDYMLKPFDNARFARTLDRARQRILSDRKTPRQRQSFAIKSAGQVAFIKFSEIDWIEASDYYASLHVGSRTYLLRRSMAELEEELDAKVFCRIHRSAIVKLDRVRGLQVNESGEYDVLLEGGSRLAVSRRHRKELQSRLCLKTLAGDV